MSKEKFEVSKKEGEHLKLSQLEGEWEGTSKLWFKPDKLESETKTVGTIRSILGGRFILHEYEGSIGGSPMQGVLILGYHIDRQKAECAWVESFGMGTGIMFSEGDSTDKGFSVLGHYGQDSFPEPWGWRTEFEIVSKDQIIIRAYNIKPGEAETRAVETIYFRKK